MMTPELEQKLKDAGYVYFATTPKGEQLYAESNSPYAEPRLAEHITKHGIGTMLINKYVIIPK